MPQTTEAAARARPRRVVLPQALDLVERAAARRRHRSLAVPAAGTALVAPYLPRAMLASMVAGHEEWLAELRQLTVVFATCPTSTTGPAWTRPRR